MKRNKMGGMHALAAMLALGGGSFGPLLVDENDARVKADPRQDEVNNLSRKARKAYAKTLVETQSREAALKVALEIENGK